MGACKENLWSLCKLKEMQQTFFRHGRLKLSYVQGHRESRVDTIFFVKNGDHVGVRGHGYRRQYKEAKRGWCRGLYGMCFCSWGGSIYCHF